MLKLRIIGIRDYRVLEGRQRIGRIRFADEHNAARPAVERRSGTGTMPSCTARDSFAWAASSSQKNSPRQGHAGAKVCLPSRA